MTTSSGKRGESVKTDTGVVSLNDREDAETADGHVREMSGKTEVHL